MTINQDQIRIQKIQQGETQVFAELVDDYKDLVFTLAIRMLKNREEAEEVAQDTFMKAYSSLDRFKGDSKFSTWLYRIAYNTSLDRIKKNKKFLKEVAINEFTEHEVKTVDTVLDDMISEEKNVVIQQSIAKLPSDDSALMTLYYFDDLSLNELSEVLDLSTNTIKVRLFRCRKKLATILKTALEPELITYYERERR